MDRADRIGADPAAKRGRDPEERSRTSGTPGGTGARGTAEIRSRFPALERVHAGRPVAYFDGPGGTQVPRTVAAAVEDYLLRHNANADWAYPTSRETDRVLEEGRKAMADLLGAEPGEIVFGANMTTLTYHVARALGRRLGPGDEIVVTELDHHANVDPWRALIPERGVEVRTVPMRPADGTLDAEALEDLVSERTAVVAVGAASNALGTVNDLARFRKAAEAAGALLFVDAVHAVPHRPVDVRTLGCDLLACSAYKFYGPHVGVLYGRRELLEGLDAPRLRPAPDRAPERLETGTLNHEGIAGATAAVGFLASLAPGETRRRRLEASLAALEARGEALVRRLWEGLEASPGVRPFGPAPGTPRTPTVAFAVGDLSAREVAARLAEKWGVFCSHGDFYAATAVARLGMAERGLVRAGCACYTTEAEVDRLLEAVSALPA